MRIRALLLTVFVIAGLALAACAPAPQPAAPAAEATATAAEATAEATEASADATEAAAEATEAAAAPAEGGCTDELGCVEIAAGDPIKIGYALVTAGPNSALGEDSVRGIEIAVDDMGGKILDHPVEIVGEDTGCSPEGGQAAATKLASDTSLVAVVGTSCSSESSCRRTDPDRGRVEHDFSVEHCPRPDRPCEAC